MKQWIEQHPVWGVLIGSVVFLGGLMTLALLSDIPREAVEERAPETTQKPGITAAEATAQFKELMDLSEKGNLVSSYKFSDVERVIYVTDV